MSALIGHAKAARIMAEALESEYHATAKDVPGRPLLLHLSAAHHGAANRMEQAMREEATGREDQP